MYMYMYIHRNRFSHTICVGMCMYRHSSTTGFIPAPILVTPLVITWVSYDFTFHCCIITGSYLQPITTVHLSVPRPVVVVIHNSQEATSPPARTQCKKTQKMIVPAKHGHKLESMHNILHYSHYRHPQHHTIIFIVCVHTLISKVSSHCPSYPSSKPG